MKNPIALVGIARTGSSFILDILSHDPTRISYYHEPLSSGALTYSHGLWRYENPYQEAFIKNAVSMFYGQGILSFLIDPQFISLDTENEDTSLLYEYFKEFIRDGAIIKFINILFRIKWLLDKFPNILLVLLSRHPFTFTHSITSKKRIGVEEGQTITWLNGVYELLINYPKFLYVPNNESFDQYDKSFNIWASFYKYILEINEEYPNRTYILRYEDVCSDPKNTFSKLYNHFGEDVPKEIIKRINSASKFRSDAWFGQEIYAAPLGYGDNIENFNNKVDQFKLEELMGKFNYKKHV